MVQEPKNARSRSEALISLLMSDWRPAPWQVLWGVRTVIVLCLLLAVSYPYGITPWDWIELLLVPAAIALVGLSFNRQQQERALQSERERARDEALQTYLDQMGQLLLDKQSTLRDSEENNGERTLARVRTLTVLARLDGERRASVLQFLYESELITRDDVIVDLKGADLSDADLTRITPTTTNLNIRSFFSEGTFSKTDMARIRRVSTLNRADLGEVNLSRVNLSSTDLYRTDLHSTNLSGADLSKAFLSEADLSKAFLSEADLSGADLSGATLSGATLTNTEFFRANLSGADLSNATFLDANLSGVNLEGAVGWDEELLRGAKTLADATMPDGQKYKEKESRGED